MEESVQGWLAVFPQELRWTVLICVALYFLYPVLRRTWVEYRYRTHELAKQKAQLEILKLQVEIQNLQHSTGQQGKQNLELDDGFKVKVVDESDSFDKNTEPNNVKRFISGALGAQIFALLVILAVLDKSGELFAWSMIFSVMGVCGFVGAISGKILGETNRSAFFYGLLGPILISALIGTFL